MATGDVVNTASRLQSAAPVNGVIVGEMTYRATAETIEYREHEPVEAKGKQAPIPVWEVAQARARFGVDLAPEERTPLVGREREVAQIVDALGRVRDQRASELLTLVGVPGIGKSRLVGELFQAIERGGVLTYWRQGRSLPYGAGVSYWALAEMVKAQAGILETDSDNEVEAKLAGAVERLVEEDTEWVLAQLRPLVGQGDARGTQEESFAAWRRFFEAMADQRPLVLVFEDLQWADDGLLDFVEHLADWVRDVPLLIVCTARPELLERRAAWGGGKPNATTLTLAPLSDEETAELIAALGAETESGLLERAGGNPLYAEQFVRMLAERGEGALPESVQGIIAARLDALAPEEKSLLQNAAVLGKVFWLGALGATEQQLHVLRQKEFVQRARRSSVEGETEFAFKHALVRDVAYGQIPRADRSRKHLRAAEWIESLGRPEDHSEMVAHHYLSALELARAAGQDVGALAGPAQVALSEAGDRAASLNALAQAEHYYSEALALMDGDGRGELLFRLGRVRYGRHYGGVEELQEAQDSFLAAGKNNEAAEAALMLADIAWSAGNHEELLSHMAAARSFVEGAPRSRAHASVLAELSRYEMLADHNDTALEFGRQALDLAGELGLDDLRSRALNNIGCARVSLGDPGGLDDLEESIALAIRLDAIADVVRGHNNIATMHVLLGNLDESRDAIMESVRVAERYGLYGFLRFAAGGPTLGDQYNRGHWDEVLAGADAYLAAEKGGSPDYQTSSAYVYRGLIRLGRGDAEGAQSDAQRAVESARPAQDPQILMPAVSMAAFVRQSCGDESGAAELLDEAFAVLSDLRQLGFATVWAHALAWVARKLGRGDEFLEIVRDEPLDSPWVRAARATAVGDFTTAADIVEAIGAAPQEALFRLWAAEQSVDEGRRAEADEQLRRALAFDRSVGATRYVREGEALLAASA
jgi:tetratricopeptide (TPR) repeat protein